MKFREPILVSNDIAHLIKELCQSLAERKKEFYLRKVQDSAVLLKEVHISMNRESENRE